MSREIPGIRIVTESLPWCHTAAIGVWIASGSSDEGSDEHGAAHFLEHVLFKRTATRSGREVAEEMDLLGGELNAYTGREHTCFHVQVPAEGVDGATRLLADIVAGSIPDSGDVEVERDVILDELAARSDDPEDLATDMLIEAVLGDDVLGRSVLGSEKSVAELDAERLRRFHFRSLRPGRVVISAAGRLDHDHLVDLIAGGPLPAVVAADGPNGDTPGRGEGPHSASDQLCGDRGGRSALWTASPTLVGADEATEQTHVVLGRRTPPRASGDRAAAQIACAVLGGGLSSRLFQFVREDLGLAYSVYAAMDQFADTGVLSVVAGCADHRLGELLEAVRDTVAGLTSAPPSESEVGRAAAHLTGSIRLGLDDPMSRMARIGRHLLDRDEVFPVADSVARLAAVTGPDVADYWRSESAPWCLAVVGRSEPEASREESSALLERLHARV